MEGTRRVRFYFRNSKNRPRLSGKAGEPGKRHKKETDKPKKDDRHDDDKTTIDELV